MGTKKWSLGLAAAAPACGLMLATFAAPANATAYLEVYDSQTGTAVCNQSSPTDAPLVCDATSGTGSWSVTVDTGLDGSSSTLGKVDLSFDAMGTAPPADNLYLLYYVDDLTGNGATNFVTTLGGTADSGLLGNFASGYSTGASSELPASDFCGQTGPDFGTSTSLATFCNETGAFSGSQYSSGNSITGPYQLGLVADLDLMSGTDGTISGDIEVAQVPEPATFALFGAGLLGCALFLRRRRSSND